MRSVLQPIVLTLLAAAGAAQPAITIDDVVRIRYPSSPVWSPDGKSIAFLWDDRGQTDLWVVDVASRALWRVTDTEGSASALSWSRDGRVRYLEEGKLWSASRGVAPEVVIAERTPLRDVRWSANGAAVSYRVGDSAWLRVGDGTPRRLRGARRMRLSPDGVHVFAYPGGGVTGAFLREVGGGKTLWKAESKGTSFVGWQADGRAFVVRRGGGYVRIDVATGEETRLCPAASSGVQLSPAGDAVLFSREDDDGWRHLRVAGPGHADRKPLTRGDHRVIDPAWSPDGASVVYASNLDTPGQRHLYRVPVAGGEAKKLTAALPGTNVEPVWSPDGESIVFLHCGPHRAVDLWVMPAGGGPARQLTASMPAAFTEASTTAPERVTFKGALDWDIDGWLMKPRSIGEGRRLPAVVWLHGGPIREMRNGWHPRRGYSIFHSYHQRLVQKGYVVLAVNYRGGIGRGKAFEKALRGKMGVDDVLDVIGGGKYLKTLPFVDPERVGVWGLSYGGYLTMQALGKHPGTFCMGINVAGVFNWATQIEIYGGRGRFVDFMGGMPDQNPDAYRVGSPSSYVQNIDVPLLHLQGTADRNVPFTQLDEIVRAMVTHDLPFEVMYYPDQPHVFADGDVWRHAFGVIERFFDRRLGAVRPPGAQK